MIQCASIARGVEAADKIATAYERELICLIAFALRLLVHHAE